MTAGAMVLRIVIKFLSLLILTDLVSGLRDVRIRVPLAVPRGDDTFLICDYNLENDTLYSVKWYKGRREFYRYLPKENPAMKIFPLVGIHIERSQSNVSHVLLKAVDAAISGKFSCEISADAPSFHTEMQSAEMMVVDLPQQHPVVTGLQSRYRHGETVQGNCTSFNSKPVANLTWKINDMEAPLNTTRLYAPVKNLTNSLETVTLEIKFLARNTHFINSGGRLKLTCVAKILDMYEETTERSVQEDLSKENLFASSSSNKNNHLFHSNDQPQGGQLSSDGLYYTHQTIPDSSSARTIRLTTPYLNAFILYGSILLSIGSLLSLKLHHSS